MQRFSAKRNFLTAYLGQRDQLLAAMEFHCGENQTFSDVDFSMPIEGAWSEASRR
jgi:hypothetical protein